MKQIFVGKTVEDAKELAAQTFKTDISAISFEIIEEPKKSLFGKLKGEAKVEASYEMSKLESACAYIRNVTHAMGYTEIETATTETETGAVIEMLGNGSDELIGKRGDLIDSLQYLASLVCNKGDRDYYRISLDCMGYRDKRKAQLETLAAKIARNVIKTGRTSALEPMNPYERRIIHSVISEMEGVSSRSKGDEPYRKVLVSPTGKQLRENTKPAEKRSPGGNNRTNNRDGNRNRNSEPTPMKAFDMKTSFEKEYKKPRPEDNLPTGLYSKIEL